MQIALNSVANRLEKLGLTLSADKSNYCVFSRGRRRMVPSLKIKEQPLSVVENAKYLGIWLDRSLLWGKHINETIYKCAKIMNLLTMLSGTSWGVHTKHLRRLYISLIRSRMDYGCFIYDCSAESHISKLDRLQNQALRIIGGYIKSTPIHVMESDLHIAPLMVRRKYLAYKYSLKALSWTDNVTTDQMSKLSELCQNRYWERKKKPLLAKTYVDIREVNGVSTDIHLMFTLDVWLSYIDINAIITTDLDTIQQSKKSYEPNSLLNNLIQELYVKYKGWHKIYTDGSKSDNGLGVGIYDQTLNYRISNKIDSVISIMTLELIAIDQALAYALNHNFNKIVIFTDSKSSLQHLARCASGCRGTSIAYKIIRKLNSISKRHFDFKLQWVPAHVGLRGNEEADRISKLATIHGTKLNYDPDYSEYITNFKVKCFLEWQSHFDNKSKDKGIWYKTIQNRLPRKPWFDDSNLSRIYIKLALRLRSGHYPSAKFAFLMKKAESDKCPLCEKVEDVQHLLMECVRNDNERQLLMSEFKLNILDIGLIQSILSEPNSKVAIGLCRLVTLLQ
jgi:ribonuclease HI